MRLGGSPTRSRDVLVLGAIICLIALPLEDSAAAPSGHVVTVAGALTVTIAEDLVGGVDRTGAHVSTATGDVEIVGGADLASLSGRAVRVSGRLAEGRIDAASVVPTDAPTPDTAVLSVRATRSASPTGGSASLTVTVR